tara:strand:+ start:85 stop:720 length:636 start_codon:yes stop_codon:yes gene_type:complete
MIDTLIFGGTFDPVHCGHVTLAESILGVLEKDAQIVFIPNKEPPHRRLPVASARERIDMLNLALQGRPNICVDDIEIKKGGVSYSIQTVKSYRRRYGPNFSLSFLVGLDAWQSFSGWNQCDEFSRHSNLIVYSRPGQYTFDNSSGETFGFQFKEKITELSEFNRGCLFYLSLKKLRISSSSVRVAARRREDLSSMVNPDVADYIALHQIYN